MFAIVKTGGKQYRVGVGDQITVERLEGDVGAQVSLNEVLAVGGDAPKIGTPIVDGASVTAKIVQQPRGTKVIVFKKKRRKNYRRKRGHRQELTVLKIQSISADGSEPVASSSNEPAAETPPNQE
ncbi:MAG TPA: 50S ribosomal protein L21 [Candidatus Binataceae bacterium]|nr:50S ribosomal protein L21 [Candidatus Binataceae bacterium]